MKNSGNKPPDPHSIHRNYGRIFWYSVFDPLGEICDMQEFLTLNKIDKISA